MCPDNKNLPFGRDFTGLLVQCLIGCRKLTINTQLMISAGDGGLFSILA